MSHRRSPRTTTGTTSRRRRTGRTLAAERVGLAHPSFSQTRPTPRPAAVRSFPQGVRTTPFRNGGTMNDRFGSARIRTVWVVSDGLVAPAAANRRVTRTRRQFGLNFRSTISILADGIRLQGRHKVVPSAKPKGVIQLQDQQLSATKVVNLALEATRRSATARERRRLMQDPGCDGEPPPMDYVEPGYRSGAKLMRSLERVTRGRQRSRPRAVREPHLAKSSFLRRVPGISLSAA